MRKLIVCIAVIFASVSCEEDVKFNDPSFQALKNDVFWRAIDSRATLFSDGSLLIEAFTSNEVLSIRTVGIAQTTYLLEGDVTQNVVYSLKKNAEATIYRTDGATATGQVIINKYDEAGKMIAGTFKFKVKTENDSDLIQPILSFREGVFYNLPVRLQMP